MNWNLRVFIKESGTSERPAVGWSGFHEKAVKFEIQFISLPLVVRCALGSGFHADSGGGPCLDPI
jgi:hypothetical protein